MLTLAPEGREKLTVVSGQAVNFPCPGVGHKMVARGEVLAAGRRPFVCKYRSGRRLWRGKEGDSAALQKS